MAPFPEPTTHSIVIDTVIHLLRGPFLCTLVYFLLYDVYNAIYDHLSSYTWMSDAYIYSLGSCIIHISFYWPINSFFLFCDTYGYLQQYKLHRLTSQTVSD